MLGIFRENNKFYKINIIESIKNNDLSTLKPSHSFIISKSPTCTDTVTVVTSIGSFTIPGWVTSFKVADSKTLFSITSVTGTTDLTLVHFVGQKLF